MAHSNNIISKIQLPGSETIYEIHDEHAIHDADLAAVMEFMGSVDTKTDLPTTNVKKGNVYLVTDEGNEYVATAVSGTTVTWEELGTPLAADHTHPYSGTTDKQNTNTVTGSVTIPTISSTKKYLGASASQPTVTHSVKSTDIVLGESTTFTVGTTPKYLSASASGTTVGANGTASVVTGYASPATSSFVKAVTSESAEVVGSISTGTGSAVTGLETPTDTFIKSYPGATSSAITGLGTPSTGAFITGLDDENPPTTDTFVKSVSTTSGNFVTSVTPTNSKLVTTSVTGVSGSTTASKVTSTTKKLVTTTITPAIPATAIGSVSASTSKLDTISVIPAVSNGTAIKTVTAPTGSVIGVQSTTTTASKATAGTAKTFLTGVESIKIDTSTLSDGILTFVAATHTTDSITPYTFSNVTVPIKATASSTFVTGVSTTTTDVAKAGTAVSVADGTLSSSGSGSSVATGVTTTPANVAAVGEAVTVATGESAADAAGASFTEIVTATNVTVPKAATSAITVATGSASASGAGASLVASISAPTAGAVTKVDTTSGNAITSIEDDNFTTSNALTALGTPTTKSFLTGLGTPTTGTAIKSITPTTGTFVNSVTPTEATVLESIDATSKGTALTGLGTASTKSVLTGVKVTAQPTITLTANDATATGRIPFVQSVDGVTVGTNDKVTAITAMNTPSVTAPVITLTAYDSTGTGRVQYIHDVTTGSTTAALQSGKVADHTHTFSGNTGGPN